MHHFWCTYLSSTEKITEYCERLTIGKTLVMTRDQFDHVYMSIPLTSIIYITTKLLLPMHISS